LELLHELLPTANKIVSLLNPGNPNANAYTVQTQAATDALGLRLQVLTAHTEADLLGQPSASWCNNGLMHWP